MGSAMFHGSITALITPFTETGIDEDAFRAFVAWQIAEGSHGLVPCGTTGESPTLSHEEHHRVIDLCIEMARSADRHVPVIAGTGSNNTAEAVSLTRHAAEAGADAVLVVTPYYNKPTQEGLYQHYRAVHEAAEIPVIIYNIPGRSVVDMSVDTMKRLAELPRIRGVKDATADLARPLQTRLEIGADFCQLSGEDATATAFLAQGGHGCISVTANAAPSLCAQMQDAWRQGDLATMQSLRDRLAPLHRALFLESSPAPVKYACAILSRAPDRVRMPLAPITRATQTAVREAMVHAGLINA